MPPLYFPFFPGTLWCMGTLLVWVGAVHGLIVSAASEFVASRPDGDRGPSKAGYFCQRRRAAKRIFVLTPEPVVGYKWQELVVFFYVLFLVVGFVVLLNTVATRLLKLIVPARISPCYALNFYGYFYWAVAFTLFSKKCRSYLDFLWFFISSIDCLHG